MKKVIICMLAVLFTLHASGVGKTKTSDFKPTFGLKNKTNLKILLYMGNLKGNVRGTLFKNKDDKNGESNSYTMPEILGIDRGESLFLQFPDSLGATFPSVMIFYIPKAKAVPRVKIFAIDPKQTYFLKFSNATIAKQEGKWFKTAPGGYSTSGNKIPAPEKISDKQVNEIGLDQDEIDEIYAGF